MTTKKERMTRKESAVAREAGRRVGREYCVAWITKGGMTAPPCKGCKLAKRELDCKKNPIGYRDYAMSGARARALEELRSIVNQLELPTGRSKP